MYNDVTPLEERLQFARVAHVELDHFEVIGIRKGLQVRILLLVRQVRGTHPNMVSLFQEFLGDVAADISCAANDACRFHLKKM